MCIKQREPAKNVLKKWKSIIDFFVSPNVVLHDGNGRTGRQLLNFVLLRNGYRPVAIKYDAGRSYARGLEAWQVDGKPDSFCSIFLDCVEQEEQTLVDLIERLSHLR